VEEAVVADDPEAVSSLRAVAHPVRLRILSLLTGTELSAAEVARELDLTHANASYHLRVLAEAGELVVASEEKIRGGTAKRYRHPWELERVQEPRGRRSPRDAEAYLRAMAEELVRRARSRKRRSRQQLTDAELWVTPEVWAEAVHLVAEASTLLHSEARPPRSPGTVHVNMTAATFEMEP
jgi:DNA-binding transcriptional ArsR family regulator